MVKKQLLDHMKRVWKIGGVVEENQIEAEGGKKFVLEFSDEGDWKNALQGGP